MASTADNGDPALHMADAAEEEGVPVEELKELKRLRGRKASAFSRACTTTETWLLRNPDSEEMKKRLEMLNIALKQFLEASDAYVSKLEEVDEIAEAGEYAARVTGKHAEITKKLEEAIKLPLVVTPPEPAVSRVSESRVSRGSRVSVTSREAEISVELKELELRQLRARQKREEEKKRQDDLVEAEQRRAQEKIEADRRKRENLMQIQTAEEEVERARLKARLWKAAESELTWERREDFEGEDRAEEEEPPHQATTSVAQHVQDLQSVMSTSERHQPTPQAAIAPPVTKVGSQNGRSSDEWIAGLQPHRSSEYQAHGPSVFAKSIPRLTLPTFRGDAKEWPRWIGLFKALVHDQPSLSDSERMAHLQNAVDGPASQAIDGMLYDGMLYHEALKTLQERFGREEDITRAHLQSIFAVVPPTLTDLPAMERFYAVVHNTVMVLRNLGYVGDLLSSENLRRVVAKLPSELSRVWGAEVFRLRPDRPTLETFSEWLKTQVSILSYSATSSAERKHAGLKHRDGATARKSAFVTGANCTDKIEAHKICVFCEGGHTLLDCSAFLEKSPAARMEVVQNERLCFACLKGGHWSRRCRAAKRCGVDSCKSTHHRLLHRGFQEAAAKKEGPKARNSEPAPFVAASRTGGETDTLLQVVRVRIHGESGSKDVLALLDTGAQTSLCSEDVIQELGITGERRQLCIQNVEGSGEQKPSERVTLKVSALSDGGRGRAIDVPEAWSVPALNVTAPTVSPRQLKHCDHLRGLKFPQYGGGEVKLLLGGNVLEAVLQKEARVGRPNQPAAVKTEFGWTLVGSVSAVVPNGLRQVMFLQRGARCEEDDLTAMVREWWSTEAFGTKYEKPVSQSKEDGRALSILEGTTKKLADRYETGMLWKEDLVKFPDNREMALKRLQATEKSLNRRTELAKAYQETMESYIQQGHARKLTTEEALQPNDHRWFLPHHAVTNPNKPGKVRVVFDAAAKFRGTSLNDKLLTGPDMLRSLPGVLLRFREEKIALTADIEKMFHQVRVSEEDQPALSFLWRDLNTTKPQDVYQMRVVIFGAKSSPAMANYVLQKTAQDYSEQVATPEAQEAASTVRRNFYMDDFLASRKTPEDATVIQQEMTKLLASGGFRLTKWLSNSRKVLEDIPSAERAAGGRELDLHPLPTERALGVIWDSEKDTLSFQVATTDDQATKRKVLSQTASVFDPLGIGTPFVIRAKILMQHLWTLELEWDQPMPDPEAEEWRKWLEELQSLKGVSVPRCVKPSCCDPTTSQFHVFCDASEAAFGAVIYLRTSLPDGGHHCSFVVSKTRVAPLKQLSIVRLELQAAVLAARLMDTVLKDTTLTAESVTFWSDSKVVLQYIANESRRFHVFVANRVAEIHDLSKRDQWRHVPGALNPADDCTRGLVASELTPDCRWLCGPDFLWQDEENWPTKRETSPLSPGQEEVKEERFAGHASTRQSALPDPTKFSSWTKYRRVVAWQQRFVRNLAAKHIPGKESLSRRGALSAAELMDAEKIIFRQAQREKYQQEITELQSGASVHQKSDLRMLAPYLDSDNILRVGGRLRHSPLTKDEKHPIILPRRSEVTRMVISEQHCRLLHAGVEHTLNELRGRFWIPRGRSEVKKTLHGCAVCRNRRAVPQPPMMADMPPERFDTSRPFSTVGIDYLGPLTVRKFRKTEKRYVLLVTCLATRAVHLEVAHSLDTDSFIMALRRFMARRGKPSKIISDNGTNFVGGERELREAIKDLNQERIVNELSKSHIDWQFLPPAASHMGGAWERLVSSVKRALKVVLGMQIVSDEVLTSTLCEVEHVINSRPLTYVSSDATDLRALTPDHLLLGDSSPDVPPGVFGPADLSSRKKWRHAQALASHFWKRWAKEYLPTLTVRKKWQKDVRNVSVGDLVLLADPNSPRGMWALARVIQVYPGPDGRVRSVQMSRRSDLSRNTETRFSAVLWKCAEEREEGETVSAEGLELGRVRRICKLSITSHLSSTLNLPN